MAIRRRAIRHTLSLLAALLIGPLAFAVSAANAASAAPSDASRVEAGTVTRSQGEVSAAHGGRGRTLSTGDTVFIDDTVLTGAEARVAVRLRDGSDLTLGAGGAVTLDGLIVAPQGGPGDGFSVLAGAVRLVAAPTPGATIRTPIATIGIRGTDFWAGPLAGALDVLTLEGRVEVTTAAAGVVLDAGQGTVIAQPGGAPGPASTWPADKVRAALDSVSFR